VTIVLVAAPFLVFRFAAKEKAKRDVLDISELATHHFRGLLDFVAANPVLKERVNVREVVLPDDHLLGLLDLPPGLVDELRAARTGDIAFYDRASSKHPALVLERPESARDQLYDEACAATWRRLQARRRNQRS